MAASVLNHNVSPSQLYALYIRSSKWNDVIIAYPYISAISCYIMNFRSPDVIVTLSPTSVFPCTLGILNSLT